MDRELPWGAATAELQCIMLQVDDDLKFLIAMFLGH